MPPTTPDSAPPSESSESAPGSRGALRNAVWGAEQNDAVRARLRAQLLGRPLQPVRIGRFALLGQIGAGAMGVVHAGYDDTLDRKVAIKLIGSTALGSEAGRARMLREAQAMAKLSHPNVVQIYEAGLHDEKLFLAMEFVAGQTLRRWASETDGARPWREVMAAYRQAGLGLAAAHHADLIHRDFKPDNAMIDAQGHVRVLDFGLARTTEHLEVTRDDGPREASSHSDLAAPLTRTGSLVGTLAYMAPEQLDGTNADARSDQFSFCVSVWEALYGQRPFVANSVASLSAAIADGPRLPEPLPADVPDAIVQTLRRGLRVAPSERWPDMTALLDALAFDPARRHRQWAVVAGGAALVAVAVIGGRQLGNTETNEPCTTSGEQLEGIWDDARRLAIERAFTATDTTFTRSAWERTREALDGYAFEWTQTHQQTCQATAVHGEQSPAVMDLRMSCLYRAKRQLAGVTGVLATADLDVVRKAHEVLESLPGLERCNDVAALQSEVEPPPAAEATAVEEVRRDLASAKAERAAGRYDAAQAMLTTAKAKRDEAQIEYGPLLSELTLEEAEVLEARGEFEAAERVLQDATRLAAQHSSRDALADAVLLRMLVVGFRHKRFDEAVQLREVAEGLVAGAPRSEATLARTLGLIRYDEARYDEAASHYQHALARLEAVAVPNDLDVATLVEDLANLQRAQGKYDEAVATQTRANDMRRASLGADHPAVAVGFVNLANTYHRMGELERAVELNSQAREQLVAALGAEHPLVADIYGNLSGVYRDQGNYDEAGKLLQRAIAIQEATLGPHHPRVGKNLDNLGTIHATQGQFDLALELFERALPIRMRALGEDHPDIGDTLHNTASLHNARGDFAKARPLLEQTLAIWEAAFGPEHPRVGQCLDTLALTLRSLGEYDQAVEMFERALEVREAALGPEHPDVAQTLNNFGNTYLVQEQFERAGQLHERALTIREKVLGKDHPRVAQTLANLGAIRAEQGDYDTATAQLERALKILDAALGPTHPGVAHALSNLTQLALKRQRPDEAVKWAERSLTLLESGNSRPVDIAGGRYLLAQGLWASGKDRARAVRLARQARDTYAELGDVQAPRVAQVDAWLAEHG